MELHIKEFFVTNRYFVNFVWKLFVLSFCLGIVAVFIYPELMEQILTSFADKFGGEPALDNKLMWEIFLNNLYVSLAAWVGGLVLGIVPLFVVAVNGFILGYVATYVLVASDKFSESIMFLVVGLLPHGILEIPAFLLAAVLGLKLGWEWLMQPAQGQRWQVLKLGVVSSFKYFLWVVAALFIAAFVEVFVSGQLVNNL